MAASSPSSSLASICRLYCFLTLLLLCTHVPSSSSVSFSYNFSDIPSDPCRDAIVCHDDASFFRPAIELTKNTQTSPTSFSKGRVWYAQPVPLWDAATGEVASFTAAFSFNITPTNFPVPACKEWRSTTGDGMAFFLAPYPRREEEGHAVAGRGPPLLARGDGEVGRRDVEGESGGEACHLAGGRVPGVVLANASSGGDLDLFNASSHFNATGDGRAVAVEFDTFVNVEWDDDGEQHVGIDVNSIKSAAQTDVTPSWTNLTSPITKVAVVRYNNATRLLAVDLRIGDAVYRVNATVDFKKSLPGTVAVGFSAATGDCVEAHQILSWSFNSTLALPPPPAPEPAPQALVVSAPSIKWEPSTKELLIKVLVPVASVPLACAAAVGLLWLMRRKRTKNGGDTSTSGDDEQGRGEADHLERGVATGPRRYLYRELAAATGDFAAENLLGRGGFGSVYQGRLPTSSDGGGHGQQEQRVAIKKFSPESSQSRKEFEAEVRIISRLRHRNLVQLLGWCDSRRGLLLVYELVPGGSLDKHIHSTERLLTWPERYNIILGLGSALQYLHRDWDQRVVHGDIKPSNIMLDSSFSTKLGDFGLARLGDHGAGPQTTDLVKGTMGYIDPEFVNTHRRSTESDIYSFGIVLLEIVSGRPPVTRLDPSFTLLGWVESLCRQGAILDAADARLRRDADAHDERQMERALVIGLWCAQRHPAERPSIAEALQDLQSEDGKLSALSLQMRYKMAAVSMGERGVSPGSSSFSASSAVRSSANTGTTDSSGSFSNLPVVLPTDHSR